MIFKSQLCAIGNTVDKVWEAMVAFSYPLGLGMIGDNLESFIVLERGQWPRSIGQPYNMLRPQPP